MSLTGQTTTITRKAAGSYVDGRWVDGAATVYTAAGNVQPLNGRELLQLPEGDRNREYKKMYTAFAVQNDDVVTISGKTYQAQNVADWSDHPQPHYRVRLMLIEDQE